MYCSICNSTSYNTKDHPVCRIGGSSEHTTQGHKNICTICGSSDHKTSEHDKIKKQVTS